MMNLRTIGICFLIAIGSLCTAFAQSFIDIDRFTVMKSGAKSAGLKFGQDTIQCVRLLGKPDSITNFYSEIDEKWMRFYHYGKSTVQFLDGKLDGFEILDQSLSIGAVDGPTFKIKDKLQILKTPNETQTKYKFLDFPISYEPGNSANKSYNAISLIFLKKGNIKLDSRVALLFNSDNELFCIESYN